MTLNSEQDAIKQAVEAGYSPKEEDNVLCYWSSSGDTGEVDRDELFTSEQVSLSSEWLQDPAFWQALRRARGWTECHVNHYIDPGDCRYEEWKAHALRYFEVKLSDGSTEDYWQSLP